MTSILRTLDLGKRWIVAALLATFLAIPAARATDDAPAADAAPAAPQTPAEKKKAALEAAKEAAAAKKAAAAEKLKAAKEAAAEKKAAAIQAAKDKKAALAEKLKAAKEAAAEKKAAAIQAAKDKKAALAEKLKAAKEAAAEKKAAAIQAAKDKKAEQAEKLKAAKEAAAEKKAAAIQAAKDKKAEQAEKLKAAKEAAAEKRKAALEAAAAKKAAALEAIKAKKEAAAAAKAAALEAIKAKKEAAAAAKAAALELKLHPPGTLSISVTPKDGVVVDLTDPAGNKAPATAMYENKLAKPGTWKLAVQAPGYLPQTQDVEVTSHKPTTVTIALKPAFGALLVYGTPAGAKVTVTGPNGYSGHGETPWEAKGLVAGDYQLTIKASGYRDGYQTAAVKVGGTANVRVRLEALPSFPGMVRIPGGTFHMGSEDGDANEKPVTTVTLPAYFMDKTNVTVAAFADCVKSGKCSEANVTTVSWPGLSAADKTQWSQSCNWGKAGHENHPMNCVDWSTAKAYCEAQGRRLPTEAEWEFAARGTDGRVYPWGNQPPNAKLANACGTECRDYGKKVVGAEWKVMHETDDGWPTTSPVGNYPAGASPFGLLDMAGNVWQWVADAYAPYPGGSVTNPLQQNGKLRVDRGGGWQGSGPARLRSSLRDTSDAATRVSDLGFRCARSESQ